VSGPFSVQSDGGHPLPRLAVRASAIAGQGCFTEAFIVAGTVVAEYTGEIIDAQEAFRREDDDSRNGIYTFWISDEAAIDAFHDPGVARYINHCCTPNCEYEFDGDRILIYAVNDIMAGEELTIDYRFAAEGPVVPCHCGSPSCRGMINDAP